MKKSQIKAIGILAFIALILLFNSFITKIFNQYSICVFILFLVVISYYLIGFEKEKSRYNKDIILSIIIYLTIYYIVTYLLGLFIGFSRNIYSLTLLGIIKNIVPFAILVSLSEILRYIINSKIKENNWILALSVLVFTLIDITFTLNVTDFSDFGSVLKNLGLFILPSLSKNFLFTYLSCKVSFKPNLVYRFIMEMPKYILPIIPNFGIYIESVIYVVIPLLIFMLIYNGFEKRKIKKIILSKSNKHKKLIYSIIILILVLIVSLTSGYFKYQAIVVATGSMTPNINKGDVVVVKKLDEKEILNLNVGDVLVFHRENKIVVHRIYEIYTSGNEIFFKTKGDHNNAPDGYLIEKSEVIGTTKFKVSYVGYPTVILYEKLK